MNGLKRDNNVTTSLAQRNPIAFFEHIKTRLLAYQAEIDDRMIGDDPSVVLELQIAKTIDDADNYLNHNEFDQCTKYDSGVGTDSSEK